ncbi:MAG: methyltransferase domain-containing protein [Phycisphaerae bacterium]|nr:methyltransferase domain-containing protein [Phycisphaerae bacterium]
MNRLTLLSLLKRLVGLRSTLATPYTYHPGDVVVEDFSEFSSIPLTDVCSRVSACHRLIGDEWKEVGGETSARQSAQFYEISQNFIFDTLSANARPEMVIDKLNRFDPMILDAINSHCGRHLLDFGGGIGVFCEIAARMGKQVYYMELPGLAFEFAAWRYKKYRLPVSMIEAKVDRIDIPGQYDIVYTDAVVEHLPPVVQAEAVEALAGAVRAGGLLVLLIDLSGPSDDAPMHYDVDISGLHRLLDRAGLNCDRGVSSFCSLWRRSGESKNRQL